MEMIMCFINCFIMHYIGGIIVTGLAGYGAYRVVRGLTIATKAVVYAIKK